MNFITSLVGKIQVITLLCITVAATSLTYATTPITSLPKLQDKCLVPEYTRSECQTTNCCNDQACTTSRESPCSVECTCLCFGDPDLNACVWWF